MSELFNLQQTGGRLLGKGAYGCTFEPLPRCAGGDVFKPFAGRRAVGKVTIEQTDDELQIGRRIMAIAPAITPLYFALPTESCRPAMPIADPDVSRCDIIKDAPSGAHFSMLVMPAAGEQLLRYMSKKDQMAANFVSIFKHLLEGMILYQDAGFVHNDIHMGNILVDDLEVARYIDFGLAFRTADVHVWDDAMLSKKFKPARFWSAPEIHAMQMYRTGVGLAEGVRQMMDANHDLETLDRMQANTTSLEDTLRSVMTDIKSDVELIRKYGKRFDSWRIGYCMFIVWDELIHWSGLMRTLLWAERDKMRRVIAGLTAFDVRQRLTARQALAILDPTNRMAAMPEP